MPLASWTNQLAGAKSNAEAQAIIQANQAFQEGDTFGSWYERAYGVSPYDLKAKFDNIFSGDINDARDRFNQWYDEQSAAKQRQADYEMTRLLNQTQYADMVKGLEAAGLNPYAILHLGGMSSGNMSYSSSDLPRKGNPSERQSNGKGIAAMAVIIAALIKALA